MINRAILEINGENQKLELVRYIVGLNIIIFVGLIKGGVSEIKCGFKYQYSLFCAFIFFYTFCKGVMIFDCFKLSIATIQDYIYRNKKQMTLVVQCFSLLQ